MKMPSIKILHFEYTIHVFVGQRVCSLTYLSRPNWRNPIEKKSIKTIWQQHAGNVDRRLIKTSQA